MLNQSGIAVVVAANAPITSCITGKIIVLNILDEGDLMAVTYPPYHYGDKTENE